MSTQSPEDRLEVALSGNNPPEAVYTLAKTFVAEGMSQQEMYRLFDIYRARHAGDADETRYDAVLDAMDHIAGWCAEGRRFFETRIY